VVAQRAQVALRVGEEAFVHVLLDHLALDLQALASQRQQVVGAIEQRGFIARVQMAQAGAVQRHHAQRARLLG